MARNNLICCIKILTKRNARASGHLNKLIYAGWSDLLIILEEEMQHIARQRDLTGSFSSLQYNQ